MNAPTAVHHFTDPSTNRQFIGCVLRGFVWGLSMAFDPNRRISGLWAARRLLEEALDIPMDQESGPVTGMDMYGFTKEETRPEEAIRALSETPAVWMEKSRGSTGCSIPTRPCSQAGRLYTKGILQRGSCRGDPAEGILQRGSYTAI